MIEHDATGGAGHRLLEICVDSPAGVMEAIAGGANRIELCAALDVGGLTPSAGLVEMVRAVTRPAGVALFAMVRPRAGDFTYDGHDLRLAITEARALIAQGVDGLVFGAVRDGVVDGAASEQWIAAARAAAGIRIPCTFHRAIDVVSDPVVGVSVVAELGFDAILTSGGMLSAIDGAETIRAMVKAARGTALTIMAGAGVAPYNARALLAMTDVGALHASASVAGAPLDPRLVELGFTTTTRRLTDRAIVSALRSILDSER